MFYSSIDFYETLEKHKFFNRFVKKEKKCYKILFRVVCIKKDLAFVLLYLIFLTSNMNTENICKLKLMPLFYSLCK